MQSQQSITTQELRSIAVLAGIAALRMFGLCLILPVFAIAAPNYTHASAQNIGLAVGIYGLLQAALQVPYGMLSDRFGRKPLILLGLICILLGSITCILAKSIYTIILGRALQGSGAVGSVVMAALIDNTREQIRSRALAIVGAGMGLAFAAALVLGPWLQQVFGLVGIFGLTALLAVCGMLLLPVIPAAGSFRIASYHPLAVPTSKKQLLPLYLGAFSLHAGLAALFLVLPIFLQPIVQQNAWLMYLCTLTLAMLLAWQALKYAEHNGLLVKAQLAAIAVLAMALLCTVAEASWQGLFISLTLYFAAFCLLEASMPSLIAKCAANTKRGAALGIYSTLQFLGVFIGGMLGGWLHGDFGVLAVVGFSVSLTLIWLALAVLVNMRKVSWQEV